MPTFPHCFRALSLQWMCTRIVDEVEGCKDGGKKHTIGFPTILQVRIVGGSERKTGLSYAV